MLIDLRWVLWCREEKWCGRVSILDVFKKHSGTQLEGFEMMSLHNYMVMTYSHEVILA